VRDDGQRSLHVSLCCHAESFAILGLLSLVLPLVMCIALAPLFQTANTPSRVRDSVRVAVCNFDGGRVGNALVGGLQSIYASGAIVPYFDFIDPGSTSPGQLVEAVRDSAYFAVRFGAVCSVVLSPLAELPLRLSTTR
jgi:amino acid transporter